MTTTLAIGPCADRDRDALASEFDAMFLSTLDEATALPQDARDEVRAIAYMGHGPFTGEVMDAFPSLGVIANFGVGFDAIDTDAAQARKVRVTNTPDVLTDDVADMAVALLLARFRDLVEGHLHVRDGQWPEGRLPLSRRLGGTPVGILGLGRIGRAIAERLAPFGTPLHYWSRSEKDTPGWTHHETPEALAEAVDVMIVAVVGGPETEDIVSDRVLAALGGQGVLVNIARGTTVDEEALIARLSDGRLAGAALDVFRDEPRIDPRFLTLDNVTLQPHRASATDATRAEMGALQRRNIRAFLNGEDLPTPVA